MTKTAFQMKAHGVMFDAILTLISRARIANKYTSIDKIEDMVDKMLTNKYASVDQARNELLNLSSSLDDLKAQAKSLSTSKGRISTSGEVTYIVPESFETDPIEKKKLLGKISSLEIEQAKLQKKLETQILSLNSARLYFRTKFLDTTARPKL